MSAPSPQGSSASSGNLGFCRSKLSQISSPAGVPVGSMMRRAHDLPTATGNVLAQPLAKCSGNVQQFDRVPLAVICRANSIQGPGGTCPVREGDSKGLASAQFGPNRDSRLKSRIRVKKNQTFQILNHGSRCVHDGLSAKASRGGRGFEWGS